VKKRPDTGKWEVRWREAGRNRSKSFTVKADAKAFELRIRRARELGWPIDTERGSETLAAFIETWWRRYALLKLEPNTRESYARIWEKHIRRELGGYRLRDVSPGVVDAFASELELAGVGAPTIRKALALLSGLFRAAVTWDRVDRNPVREVKPPPVKRVRHVRPHSPERVESIRAWLLSANRLPDAMLVSVLAYAGLRPEEARALQWGDIGERTIRVERAAAGSIIKTTKTGELRTVRLLAPLAADLRAWREASGDPRDDGLVFPTRRGTLWTDYDWRNWRRRVYAPVAKAVGIEGSRPYDLRHSFASLLISEGQTVIDVARQMGNSPDVTLKTYAHVFEEFHPGARVSAADAIEASRAEFDVREMYAEYGNDEDGERPEPASILRADARTRTGDPFITSEVLYQLSYVGGAEAV
jgi:integrase